MYKINTNVVEIKVPNSNINYCATGFQNSKEEKSLHRKLKYRSYEMLQYSSPFQLKKGYSI